MDDDYISIQPGDHFTVEKDDDGYPAIKIENTVWVESPRWLLFHVGTRENRSQAIDELIGALVQLRDAVP